MGVPKPLLPSTAALEPKKSQDWQVNMRIRELILQEQWRDALLSPALHGTFLDRCQHYACLGTEGKGGGSKELPPDVRRAREQVQDPRSSSLGLEPVLSFHSPRLWLLKP